jgi:hypothetical protein
MRPTRLCTPALLVVLFISSGCPDSDRVFPPGLTVAEIFSLPDGQVVGPIAVSPEGRVAFSNGANIFTLDLLNLDAGPMQVTDSADGMSAFSPAFLSGDRLVFATTNSLTPNQIDLLAATSTTQLGSPAPATFATISASDLGLPADMALQGPAQIAINRGGSFGTGVINNSPFLFDFSGSPVGVTPVNDVFNGVGTGPVVQPFLSNDLTAFGFTNNAGQIGLTPFASGTFDTRGTTFVGPGAFPAFAPDGQLSFFDSAGLNLGTTQSGFRTFGLGSSGLTPATPAFTAAGNSFITTNASGTGLVQTTLPGSPVLPGSGSSLPGSGTLP